MCRGEQGVQLNKDKYSFQQNLSIKFSRVYLMRLFTSASIILTSMTYYKEIDIHVIFQAKKLVLIANVI